MKRKKINVKQSFYEKQWCACELKTDKYFAAIPKEPHNTHMRNRAREFASRNTSNPSWLEKEVMKVLDSWNVKYRFQQIFYMKSKGGFIKNYYIVDFYIPDKHIVLEADGKFHKDQVEYDDFRTKDIQKHYPSITVVRVETRDLYSYASLKKLRELLVS